MPDLKIKRIDERAVMPYFATKEAACFDLVATSKEPSGKSMLYGTGLVFQIPKGYHVAVYSRSGHGFNDDMRLANCVGIIDADYRGEIKVKLTHDGYIGQSNWPWVGDRVAQAMLVKNVVTNLIEVTDVDETERGDGGFGSTGK